MNVSYFAITLMCFVLVVFLPLGAQLRNESPDSEAMQALANRFLDLHYRFWPAMGALLIVLILHSVVVSHRLAGPLFRLRETLKAVMRGDPPDHIVFRQGDYLKEEEACLNDLLATLREREACEALELESPVEAGVDE